MTDQLRNPHNSAVPVEAAVSEVVIHRAEPFYNVEVWREAGRWWFHVDEVRLTGGGCRSLRAALLHAHSGIQFAEGGPEGA